MPPGVVVLHRCWSPVLVGLSAGDSPFFWRQNDLPRNFPPFIQSSPQNQTAERYQTRGTRERGNDRTA